jgi:DNA-binding transcriptional MerR regulator
MPESPERSERWLKPSEVTRLFKDAGLFDVPLSTLRAWASAGRIESIRTAGGHRRYRESNARAFVAALSQVAA